MGCTISAPLVSDTAEDHPHLRSSNNHPKRKFATPGKKLRRAPTSRAPTSQSTSSKQPVAQFLGAQDVSDPTSESQASTPVGSSPCSPLNPHPRADTAASPKHVQNATEEEVDSPDRKSLEYSDVVVDENSLLEMEELALPTQAVIDSYYPWYPDKVYMLRPGPTSIFDPKGAPRPPNEDFRLSVLRSYNLMDTDPEPRFDRLTALACMVFKTPVALVSLLDSERAFFKSHHGLGCTQIDREDAFCAYTLLPSKDPCLVVPDLLMDGRFCKNKLVVGGPKVRFYAGAPLLTEGRYIVGTLCLLDTEPREGLSSQDQELLLALSQLVVMEIEKHSKAAELQRLQTERFEQDKRGLLQAIDAFSEGLILCDAAQPGQPIVFANEGWEKISGYSLHEVIGQPQHTLLQGPLTEQKDLDMVQKACEKGVEASVEILNYRKDGTPFWNWLRMRPVRSEAFFGSNGAKGESNYFFGILSDCTVRKEKELELEARRIKEMEAAATTRAKRSFVTNVSHEIRTPMNAIIACSQLLQDSNQLNEAQRELAQMIHGSGQQLLALINDILDYSKLDAKKMELLPHEFNLWGCLDFCMEMVVLKCETKGLHLFYSMDHNVPDWIWADEVRIRQIITNLLSNAAKFTNEGGQIEMRVCAKPCRRAGPLGGASPERGPPEAELRAEEELPLYELTISVRDTGIGMPKSFQKVLFEAFTQCDNSRTKKYEGTGLGLAICKELVERMGGRMRVDSTEGVGSTFHFSIQVHGSNIETKGQADLIAKNVLGKPPTPLTGARALLVGADKAFQTMVASVVASWGMEVEVAGSVEELRNNLSGLDSARGDAQACLQGVRPTREGTPARGAGAWPEESEAEVLPGRVWAVPSEEAQSERGKTQQGVGQEGQKLGAESYLAEHKFGSQRWGGAGSGETARTGNGVTSLQLVVAGPHRFDVVIINSLMRSSPAADDGSREEGVVLRQHALEHLRGGEMPTVLLTTKDDQEQVAADMKTLECVSILSRPVRINAFYTALLSLVANQKPVSPFTASTVGGPASLPSGPPLKICIAEDNPVNQQVLIKLLKALGHTNVRTATTGVKLLKLLHEAPADVVLMDVQMPEMDGLTATTRIRATYPEELRPLVVALTADVGPDIQKECREAGMVSYLSKPIQKCKLQKFLSMCAHLKARPREQATVKWFDIT